METREEIQTDILASAEDPAPIAGLTVRPITFASVLMLRKLGNPLAAALESGAAFAVEDLEALAEFLWVQCAPWEGVRTLTATYRHGADRSRIDAAVLEFASTLTPQQLQAAVAAIARHGKQVQAVATEVLQDKDDKPSKN